MENKEIAAAVGVGFMIGVFTMVILITTSSGTYHSKAKTAIKECQKSLPRDQVCKVIGVVDESSE